MKPDVIVCWPRFADYPLWRKFIAGNRWRFDQVIVVFTRHDGRDISSWVREHLRSATFVDSPPVPPGRDWRDVAVNAALDVSHSEWVWFTEQDFFITDEDFWRGIHTEAQTYNVIGWRDGNGRLHPSCLFVRRVFVDGTTRYFGTPPIDHFWTFTHELMDVEDVSLIGDGYEHMQGLTQNHALIDAGIDEGVFEREQFRRYLWLCLEAKVPLEPGWEAAARKEIGQA